MLDGVSMGGVLWRLRRLVVGPRENQVQFECRRCGRSIAEPRRRCPGCGADEVARYEL